MNHQKTIKSSNQIFITLFVLSLAILPSDGFALDTVKMPEISQTKKTEPLLRRLHLKLPLSQPMFHWTFLSKDKFLAGRLVLHITRSSETKSLTIFEYGRFMDGWKSINFPNPKAGEIYFGFESTKKHLTAPGDRIRLELWVMKDLKGIGAWQSGILLEGNYKTEGEYSGLLDEFIVPEAFSKLPEETISKIREQVEFKAFMENWNPQWSLKITEEEGWLNAVERKQMEQLIKTIEESKEKETEKSEP
ncbi:MAG: hypothetical protein HOH33_15345 [Verrucomicrobia bacterium]|nr:hypothetical protein [Verrucomicrobiota bacterium]